MSIKHRLQKKIRLLKPVFRKYPEQIAIQKIRAWCDKAERSHWDVRKKLTDWGLPYTEREQIIGFLIGLDLLNEERYAKAFAHDKFTFNRWGSKKIEQQLKAKGISQRNILDALKEIAPEDSSQTILALIKKKETQITGLKVYQKKIKIARFIMSKGFEQDLVWKMISKHFEQ